ncbi:Foldase protein PrsA precursor [compost metagenome]
MSTHINQQAQQASSQKVWMIASLVLLAVLIVYIIIYPPGQKSAGSSDVLAKVNDVAISKNQLYDTLVATGGQQALQKLIDKELISQEAKKANIQITDAEKEAELATVKKQFSTEEEFAQALAYYGLTLESMKEDMTTQLQIQKILEPQVTITDDSIKQYYDANLDSLKTPAQVKASHILVATKEEADAILAELKNGADFAKIAQEKSLDTATKAAGGNLDFIPQGTKEEPFDTAAFALTAGSLSDVVQTSEGFHIIKATERKEAATPTLEEKKEEIRKQLTLEQVGTLSTTWIEEKKAQAVIENSLTAK